MCALNTKDSTVCTKPGWIILMKHQLIAFVTLQSCNKIHFGPLAVYDSVPDVLQCCKLSARGCCMPTHCCKKRTVVDCLAIPRDADCCTLVGDCLTLKKRHFAWNICVEWNARTAVRSLTFQLSKIFRRSRNVWNVYIWKDLNNRDLWEKSNILWFPVPILPLWFSMPEKDFVCPRT